MKIKKVTVIGANGTMGRNVSAIFASFGNAKVYLVSRNIEKSVKAKEMAYLSVKADSIKEKLEPKDYSQLEECINDSELIFEACAESWEVKKSIHERISEILSKVSKIDKIICSGTSGLSITGLALSYNELWRTRFVGMHFFNPPYSMPLCELIPTDYTDYEMFNELYVYTEQVLYRTVAKIKDTPAFLGNRIGFQFINEALRLAEKYKYNGGIDYIDAIFGSFTGRVMPPLTTADFVGLDVHKALMDNLYSNTNDFARNSFVLPEFVEDLVRLGKLGRKKNEGLYKRIILQDGRKVYQVYDIEQKKYREVIKYTFPFVEKMVRELKEGNYNNAIKALIKNNSMEAEICCQLLLNYILYSLYTTNDIGESIHSADDVMATGFNWCPPLALFQAFSEVCDFEILCRERLDESVLDSINLKNLLGLIETSKYDYRRFIRAKR